MSSSVAVRASFRHSSPSEEGEEGRAPNIIVEIKARGISLFYLSYFNFINLIII